jgi:hypothetical protein
LSRAESCCQQSEREAWGRLPTCAPIVNRRWNRRVNNPLQDDTLPHGPLSAGFDIMEVLRHAA